MLLWVWLDKKRAVTLSLPVFYRAQIVCRKNINRSSYTKLNGCNKRLDFFLL